MGALRSRVAVPILLVAALVVAPSLSGCSQIKGIIEQATGGQVNVGGPSVPTDFPSSDVPLIDGTVINGSSVTKSGDEIWNITIKATGVADFDKITTELTDKGFTANDSATTKSNSGATGEFASDKYTVVVVLSGDDKAGWIANYTVSNLKP